MSDQSTSARVFFQPLPEHDNLNTLYFLLRLAEKVTASASGCWEWTGGFVNRSGYGKMGEDGKVRTVHRIIYKLCVGAVPIGRGVLHHCDNPPCCRPDHLFVGTQKYNVDDCRRKGRFVQNKAPGERNGRSKLTAEQVREMRRRASEQGRSTLLHKQLAEEFGIAVHSVCGILSGKKWKHLL